MVSKNTSGPSGPGDRHSEKTNLPLVSLVVPAFNEEAIIEKNLEILADYMDGLADRYCWELIVVNDGSRDRSGELAERFAAPRPNVRVLHHQYNFKLGQTFRFAFNNCRGRYVVTLDLDLSYSPDHIGRMLAEMRKTGAKIVIAAPYMKGGKVSNVPWSRKMMSRWANRFLSVFAKTPFGKLTTLTGMVRAYDRRFLSGLVLKAMDVDIHSEILYKAMILRARIVEIPAHLDWHFADNAQMVRKSSMRILSSIMLNLTSGFMLRPFMFFLLPGLFLMVLAAYPLAWATYHTVVIYGHLIAEPNSLTLPVSKAVATAFLQSPQSFIVGSFALIIAIQLICLGFLSLQNKRNYEELFYIITKVYRDRSGIETAYAWGKEGIQPEKMNSEHPASNDEGKDRKK